MKEIKLTQGRFAIVDDELFNYLNQWKWSYHAGYAVRSQYIRGKRSPKTILMHRIVNESKKGFDTDHINRNKLDNRKENLRTVTSLENHTNMGDFKHNSSGNKGVHWDKSRNKWMAFIVSNYKFINLGRFTHKEEAVNARQQAERELRWLS